MVNLILLYSGFGNIVAFKDYHITGEGFIDNVMKSKWVGFDNFKFLFSSKDAYIITRNTVLYNLGFIFLGLIVSVGIAIIFSELRSKNWSRCFKPPCSSPILPIMGYHQLLHRCLPERGQRIGQPHLNFIWYESHQFLLELWIWPALLFWNLERLWL